MTADSIYWKGRLQEPRSDKPSICNIHLEIAQEIFRLVTFEEDRTALLGLVDLAYHMGKKMDRKLREYKSEFDVMEKGIKNESI